MLLRNYSVLEKTKFSSRCDTSKKYHSAVPHENSAFKIFACASLILYCEHISPIKSNFSYLLQNDTRLDHLSAKIAVLNQTLSCRRLL